MAPSTTWLVMLRDVSTTIRVQHETQLVACLVLEMESGDVLSIQVHRTEEEALTAALQGAVRNTAGPRSHGLPGRIRYSATFARLITGRLRVIGRELGLDRAELVEAPPLPEAEDIFDSFIGQMSGRAQPREFAAEHDWRMLYELALSYLRMEPWKRWADDVDLRLDLTVGRERSNYAAVIIGQEGIQRGLVMYPGTAPPQGLREWKEGMEVPMPDGTLMFHLDPRGKLPAEYEAKAGRYGWPGDAEFVPLFWGMSGDGAADLGYDEVVRLTLGIQAAMDIDRQGITVAGHDAPACGSLKLPDGTDASYEICQRPPTSPEPGTLQVRMHEVGTDLVPKGSHVSMGSVPLQALAELRRRARLHRPTQSPPSARMETVPLVAIHPRIASGEAIAGRIADDDPFGVHLLQDGRRTLAVLACAEAAHALMEIPSEAAALALFRTRMESAGGFHVLLVADENATRTEGTIYGMFECVTPVEPPATAARASRRSSKPGLKRRGRR